MSDAQNSPADNASTRTAYPIAIALIAAGFLLFEIVERLWLHDLDESTRHHLHQARGVIVAALVAAVAMLAAVRRRPMPFPPPRDLSQTDVENHLVHLTSWFLWMRWLACATATTFSSTPARATNRVHSRLSS